MSSTSSEPVEQKSDISMCDDENLVHLWRGADKVELSFFDQLDGSVCKVVSVRDRVFLMTTTCSLYYGEVTVAAAVTDSSNGSDENESSTAVAASLTIRRSQFTVVDLSANSEHVFAVSTDGSVFKIDPQSLGVVDTITLREDIKYCSHGYE